MVCGQLFAFSLYHNNRVYIGGVADVMIVVHKPESPSGCLYLYTVLLAFLRVKLSFSFAFLMHLCLDLICISNGCI